jgi:hypothetical protein
LSFAVSPVGDEPSYHDSQEKRLKVKPVGWPVYRQNALIFRRFRATRAAGTFAPLPRYRSGIWNRGWAMSQTYIIEVGSQPAGIVVRNPEGYVFFAASHRFNRLDGQLFRNAREAERAARRVISGGAALAA